MSAPIDDTSGYDSGESTSPVDTSTTSTTGGDQAAGVNTNPAWDPFLSELPEYFHPKAKEHFAKWDENYRGLETKYRELEGKYKPYESYLSVDPNNLQQALNVYQAINADPRKVYEALTEHLQQQGLLPAAQEEVNMDQPDVDPRYQELDSRYQSLNERQQQIDAYIEQQAYNQQVSTYEQQIDAQVQGVLKKYGNAVDQEDLLSRIFMQTQMGKEFDAEAAFAEQKATFQRLYQRANGGRPAPQVIPTNGTPAPSGEVNPSEMNEDQRKAYFKQLLDIANAGG